MSMNYKFSKPSGANPAFFGPSSHTKLGQRGGSIYGPGIDPKGLQGQERLMKGINDNYNQSGINALGQKITNEKNNEESKENLPPTFRKNEPLIKFIEPKNPPCKIFPDKNLEEKCDDFVESLFNDFVTRKENNKINVHSVSEDTLKDLQHYDSYLSNIIKIQNKWKSYYDRQKISILREKVFYIQRSFRSHLVRKFKLPDNFYYNDKYMKIQNDIFEANYRDNLAVLFPALFLDKSDINYYASNMLAMSVNPTHSPYETGKIHLFAKILDMDMMVETDEVYENLWASVYNSIYLKCLKNNCPIQSICLGGQHTMVINNKGKIYSFGWNNYGQCGVPINSTVLNKSELKRSNLVEITKYNELRTRVLNRVDGVKIPEIDQIINSNIITCGEDHSLILDQEGKIWAFGLNLNGELGLGHDEQVDKPTKISDLRKHNIINVKSEGNINFAISKKGDCFMWPWNDRGEMQFYPKKLPFMNANEKITSLACGSNFVLLLNSNGMVYSMGRTNKYGQLGHGDYQPRLHPELIKYFVNNSERICQISCGYKHCVAKSNVGRAYTWGFGAKGQLGQNTLCNLTMPNQVCIFDENFVKIIQVSAGFRCTFFLTENRKIYACGCNGTISMERVPIQFDIIDKIPEMSLEQSYSVVRIMNTWNKSFSIFYATVADSTTLKISPVKLSNILNQLAAKWDYEGIKPPYIESIAKYFPISYMNNHQSGKF